MITFLFNYRNKAGEIKLETILFNDVYKARKFYFANRRKYLLNWSCTTNEEYEVMERLS